MLLYKKSVEGEINMAKLSFTKLGLKLNQEVVEIHHNDQIIEVKQYLPVNDKLELLVN